MTELRLAGAITIEEANAVLKEFLDRFNARFGVAARHPETAYRPLGPGACLDTVLCFRHSRRVARDNTVKYRWRTLRLLPEKERRSYAGAVVDVLEGQDGHLVVRYQGEIIPARRPHPVRACCEASTALPHTGHPHMAVSTVWAGAGRRLWRHSTLRWTPAMLTTTAPLESARHLPCSTGSPLHFRRQGGTLSRRRSAGGCRFEGLHGNWAYIGTRRRSRWRLLVLP